MKKLLILFLLGVSLLHAEADWQMVSSDDARPASPKEFARQTAAEASVAIELAKQDAMK